jgi:hypothetical protein
MNAQLRRIALVALAVITAGVLTTVGAASPSASSATARTYSDLIGDVRGAPDVGDSNFVSNDNSYVFIAMDIKDRGDFQAGDTYRIYLDTDGNPATGSIAAPGVPAGAEAAINVLEFDSQLLQWNGSAFAPASAEGVFTLWFDGPTLLLDLGDLGAGQNLNVVFVTSNGTDFDYAPDSGAWAYTVAPLQLTAGPLTVSPARAGKPLTARMTVTESEFDSAQREGQITCRAKVGGSALRGKGSFAGEHTGCFWRIPKTAAGKKLSGSVALRYQGVVAQRSFSVRVKK